MDDLRAAYVSSGGSVEVIQNGSNYEIVTKNGLNMNGIEMKISAVNRVWGGDKRLALYGYTLETINMLLLPMINTKYISQFLLD